MVLTWGRRVSLLLTAVPQTQVDSRSDVSDYTHATAARTIRGTSLGRAWSRPPGTSGAGAALAPA